MVNFESVKPPSPEKQLESEYLKRVNSLLDEFPDELQESWSAKIDMLPLLQQIETLESALSRREISEEQVGGIFDLDILLPEGVEIFQQFPDDVKEMVEKLKLNENRIEIGYGQAGHVISSRSQPEVCYKVLFDKEKLPSGTNDIAKETSIQSSVWEQMDGHYGVRVPVVYGFIHEKGTRAMIMELLDAPSLRKVVERKAENFPENFDTDTFFSALEQFVRELHMKNIYHRDLHAGNVLVDRKTGMPCVIDFGLSTDTGFDEDAAYRAPYVEGGHFKEIVLQSDLENLKKLKHQVAEYSKYGGI